jgi:inner membrane protein
MTIESDTSDQRSPGFKLLLAILVGLALTIPLFSVWWLVYDRQSQRDEANQSITAGWGAQQSIAGPVLVLPYRDTTSETVVEGGQSVTRSRDVMRELTIAPERVTVSTTLNPELRRRAIYEAVVYSAKVAGQARFAFPQDLERTGVDVTQIDFRRAELRFGISDPRGLGANPMVKVDGGRTRLQPGGGSSGGRGFFAWLDASTLPGKPIAVDFAFDLRGNESIGLVPQAGDTVWTVTSSWPSPSFAGDFLPGQRHVGINGFTAAYRIGNLALGRSLASTADRGGGMPSDRIVAGSNPRVGPVGDTNGVSVASVSLLQPVDPYSQVDRATKYGFLFIGFTFLALLMFDVVAGVRVSPVEYLLMGVALILFFVLLLAFAEVIGFAPSYLLASSAIAGLNTAYSAAILKSWRRAAYIGGLLIALYAVLYVLLSLEAYSLLIGSLLLFGALAAVMYVTRRLDWGKQAA